jgi:hypothetical protein
VLYVNKAKRMSATARYQMLLAVNVGSFEDVHQPLLGKSVHIDLSLNRLHELPSLVSRRAWFSWVAAML